MKPGINLPRVTSGKFSLGKSIFSRAKVRSVTSTIVDHRSYVHNLSCCEIEGFFTAAYAVYVVVKN